MCNDLVRLGKSLSYEIETLACSIAKLSQTTLAKPAKLSRLSSYDSVRENRDFYDQHLPAQTRVSKSAPPAS